MSSAIVPPGPRSATAAELSGCDRELIHLPGSIQPHGVLLVLDERELIVAQASENVARLLGRPVAEVLGRGVGELLGVALAARLGAAPTVLPLDSRPTLLGTVTAADSAERRFHAVAHRSRDGILLDLELATTADPDPEVYPLLDAFTLRAEAATTMAELNQLTAEEVRRLTGFDRVLIYWFDEAWNGRVVGEDGNGRLPSYLHHCFPAADIPAPARELYRVNRVRIIPDAGYQPVPVTPGPAARPPLDLSFSTLRSVSPVHVEYMRNMQTAASMSVSILRDGRLWGLIACHHLTPKMVPFQVRGLCDLLGRVFSLRSTALEHTQDYKRRLEVQSAYSRLVAVLAGRADFAAALSENAPHLVAFTAATGAAILTEGRCLLLGETPSEDAVRELANWLFTTVQKDVYGTDRLPIAHPAAQAYRDKASGLLAIAVSKLHPSYVLWFRPEVIQTIKWGGNPKKPEEPGGAAADSVAATLRPRRSFETWLQTVRDRCVPWQPSEITGAEELRNAIVSTVLRNAEERAARNAEFTRGT